MSLLLMMPVSAFSVLFPLVADATLPSMSLSCAFAALTEIMAQAMNAKNFFIVCVFYVNIVNVVNVFSWASSLLFLRIAQISHVLRYRIIRQKPLSLPEQSAVGKSVVSVITVR